MASNRRMAGVLPGPKESTMKMHIYSAVVAAGLGLAGSAFAQGSGQDSQPGGNAGPTYGPPVGSPDYYGNSGWTPPPAYPDYRRDDDRRRSAVPIHPDPRAERNRLERDRVARLERERIERERVERDRIAALERDRADRRGMRDRGERRGQRDRDGDGVRDSRDRHPNDPSRQ
jgi:hypothetical protein